MTNSGFVLTDLGLADSSSATPGGPYLHVHSFRVGSAFNYTPGRGERALRGTILHTGTPLTYTVVDNDTIEIVLQMDNSVGPFNFGEIGIYTANNVLLAVCTFSELQSKVRSVGNQGGNTWKIRARLKLAQAPVVCMVTVTNNTTLLEVNNWQSLASPANQPTGANAVIVHEQNASNDSILVFREGPSEWAFTGYGRIFDGNFSDTGASATALKLTHPGLSQVYFTLPQSESRYLIRFSNGAVRKVAAQATTSDLTWNASLGAVPTGAFSVWEDLSSMNGNIPVASAFEFNTLCDKLNRYWSAPTGVYPGTNAGINQVAIPKVTRRPTAAQWSKMVDSIRRLMLLLMPNANTSGPFNFDELVDSDFIAKPSNPFAPGISTLSKLFDKYTATINFFETLRNSLQPFYLEQVSLPGSERTRTVPFANTVSYDAVIDHGTYAARDGMANAGGAYIINTVSNNSNTFYAAWNALLQQIGSVVIERGRTYSTNGFGTGANVGILNSNDISMGGLVYTASMFSQALASTLFYRVWIGRHPTNGGFGIGIQLQIVGSVTYSYTSPGSITHRLLMNRPSPSLIMDPVHPIPTCYSVGTF